MSAATGNARHGGMSRLAYFSFLLLVISLGFPQIPIHLDGYDILLTDILFLLSGMLWIVSILLRQRRIIWLNFYWMLGAYLLAMLASALFSVDRLSSLKRFPQEAYLICLAVLAVNIIGSVADLRQFINAWLFGTSLAVAIGLVTIAIFYLVPNSPWLEYLTYHYGSVPVGNYPRLTAGFVSASMFCNYLNVGLVLVLLASSERWLSLQLSSVFFLVIVLAAIFTFSIGLGGLSLAVGLFSWFCLPLQRRTKLAVLSLGYLGSVFFLVTSAFALAPYPGAQILWTIPVVHLDLMPSARMLVWNDAIATFLSHPLTGIGLGMPVADVVFTNTDGTLSLLTDAHNSFLSVAAQNGIIGLAAFTYLVVVILMRWFFHLKSAPRNAIPAALGIALACLFIYQGLTGSFEDSRHLWVLIGMFWAADRIRQIQN